MTITELTEIFYFGQVFVFCELINKNVLETKMFLIKKRRSADAQYYLLTS